MRGYTHLEYYPPPTLWLNSKNWREIFHDITVHTILITAACCIQRVCKYLHDDV